MQATEQTVDNERLEALLGRAVVDCGGTANAALVLIGDELGLYRALAEHGPLTPDGLAAHTNTTERYVREWLGAQAASAYVGYDPATERYAMSPEQVMAFADETSPVFLPGAFEVAIGFVRAGERIRDRFLSGDGYGWHEQDEKVHRGTERFFRNGYQAHLVNDWIPTLDGVEARLRTGGSVADVTWLLVEPRAGDRVEDNLNPVGRLYYAGSTLACTPNALSQDGRAALGAQAGEARLREVVTRGGFSRFRRATETPFNLVLEARP